MIDVLYRGGVHVPSLDLWMDPSMPRGFAFVSHAHSDHIGKHRETVLSPGTSRLMRARQGEAGMEHVLAFGETRDLRGAAFTLLPAGHVHGSAQLHLQTGDGSLLYTGDFKLRPGLSSEPIEWRAVDTLIMETTFGKPEFVFPPTEQVFSDVIKFCREALEDGEVPVLLGYSLGKAQEILLRLGWTRGQVILLAGSTHPGEEEILLRLFDGLRGKHPQLRLVLVPRHAERAGSILKIARAAGFSVILRSKLEHPFLPDPQILVVDTTGELRDLYPAGDLVFIGKTLTGTGGQNFLEPARYGRAIFSGPHMENFQSLRDEFVQDRAMLICPDEESLRQEITRLLEAPEARQELGRRARACFQKHLGAGARHAEALVRLLGPEI